MRFPSLGPQPSASTSSAILAFRRFAPIYFFRTKLFLPVFGAQNLDKNLWLSTENPTQIHH